MFNIYLLIDLVVSTVLLGLGLTVMLKNSKAELNKIFSLFAGCISIWIFANYVSDDIHYPAHTSVIANYLVFFFSYFSGVYLLRFTITLANDIRAKRYFRKVYLPILLIGLTALTPLVVSGVKLQGSTYAVEFGLLAWLYFTALTLIISSVIFLLIGDIRHSNGDQKARLKVLFISLCWTLPFLLLAEFILPVSTGWFGLSNIGILPMLILVYGLFYGIIRHRLFDLRLIVVRSLAYVFTLGILSTSYGLLSYYLTKLIPKFHNNATGVLLQVALIVLVVLTYVPAKNVFNKLTNKLFYRDAYDPQIFLDQLNQTLVANIELEKLLKTCAQIIAGNLKAEYCLFCIKEASLGGVRITGTTKKSFNESDVANAIRTIPNLGMNVIVADYIPPGLDRLRSVLLNNDISVLVRLVPAPADAKKGQEGLGYVILGQKRSGNAYTSQDVQLLGIIANELVVAIQNSLHFEEIQRFNITLQQKVDDATRKLRRTNQRLEELDETKDDFISMASHQLRTPLTSVKGYLSMVLEGDAGKVNTTQTEMLHQAFSSSQRMVFLITDLLNVSRIKTGKFVIEAKPVDLSKLVEEEVAQLIETAQVKNIKLTYDKPADFPILMLDETKIRQVGMNFIDNAIYYTSSGGHIKVELIDEPTTVELRIIDDGIGVPKAEQHHLFTKFYRATNARKARPDGTGLGLFMAKKVIAAEGGSIIFESKEGQGSTFGFVFSKAKLKLPTQPPNDKENTETEVKANAPTKSLTPVR
jgi:signal transduction histidine kinase